MSKKKKGLTNDTQNTTQNTKIRAIRTSHSYCFTDYTRRATVKRHEYHMIWK